VPGRSIPRAVESLISRVPELQIFEAAHDDGGEGMTYTDLP